MTLRADGGGAIGSGSTPITGGNNQEVLFNDAGVVNGDAGLNYNKTTNVLTNTGGQFVSTGGTVTVSTPVMEWHADVER